MTNVGVYLRKSRFSFTEYSIDIAFIQVVLGIRVLFNGGVSNVMLK